MAGKKKGFTLVELSIVLVIIGLLIGGILAAQSMISTAKINAVAMQIGQFDAGVENFKTKYNYLPGDAPSFGGNGNGIVGLVPPYDNVISVYCCEIGNFWNNIFPESYAGVPAGLTGNIVPITSGANKNAPLAKFGKSGAFFMASSISTDTSEVANTIDPKNMYSILDASEWPGNGGLTRAVVTNTTNSAVIPADLLALDNKIDDGIGITGNVISGSMASNGGYPALYYQPAAGLCSNGSGIYNVSDTRYVCTPVIRIGSSVSDPQ